MKKTTMKKLAALTAITMFSAGCGGSSDADSDGDADGAGTAVAEKKGDKLGEKLVGYWSPDPEAMIKMAMDQQPGVAALDEDTMAQLKKQMVAMAKQMVFHFDGKNVMVHGPDSPEAASYVITSTDAATKTLKAKITGADGKVEDGTAILDGDKLSLIKEGEALELLRITEAEFNERVK